MINPLLFDSAAGVLRRSCHWMRALTMAGLAASALFAPLGAQSAGTIEGRIFNAATGTALANVRVMIEGTTREVLTDEAGAYVLSGVPAGSARVAVSYLGFERQTAAVSVTAGGVAQRDFDLAPLGGSRALGETVKLAEFTVVADREMSAQALAANEQRSAPNIKNVVAVDEFGDRGDENIGEFFRFLPGVALNDSGHVPNEVTLRGFPANTSSITIDGGDVMGARGGDTRAISLLEVPTSNVSRVEVTKVPTPDMPASGMGGTLNIISKGGFERKRPSFSYNVSQLFHNRSGLTLDGGSRTHVEALSPKYTQPSFNFSYQHPVNRDFAFTVGGSRTWRQKPMESGKDADETATWNLVNLFITSSDWQSLAQILKTWSAQAGFDWRLSPRDTLSASFAHRESDSYITRSIFSVAYGAGATGGATFTQGAATGVGSVSQGNGNNQDILTQTTQAVLRYRHRREAWRLEAALNWSLAESQWLDISKGHFNTMTTGISNLILRGEGTPASSGILPVRYTALGRTGAPVDIFDGGLYNISNGNSLESEYLAEKWTARADVTRDVTFLAPLSFRAGVRVDRMERDNHRYLKTWNFRPNGATDAVSREAGRFDVFDVAFNQQAPTIYGQPMRWISPAKVYDLFRAQPGWFVLDEVLEHQNRVSNSRRLRETVSAAYLRADGRFFQNRLWLVGGVRLEKTKDEGTGPLNDPSAQYQKDASGRLVDGNPAQAGVQPIYLSNDLLVRAKQRYVERGSRGQQEYEGYYPSVNASFSVSEQLVLRGAYARTIGRPNISSVVPSATFTEPTVAAPTITVTNPGLKPWTADSYDFTVESYHVKDGVGSFGVFRKDIKDFFGSVRSPATPELLELYGLPSDPTYLAYEIATTTNAGTAKITGVEFSYRQALTFLPGWARGLQVFVNGTKMSLSGDRTTDFTGFNPSAYAGGIALLRSRYAVKLTCTHQGETRRGAVGASATVPAGTYNYQDARTRWSLSAEYSLRKGLALYGTVMDFNGGFNPATLRYAPDTPEYARRQRYQELGYYTTLGIKGSF
ncbi:MAG: TonB-dependent receptor [Verrucomicrobia bacterium]|nr:TonB-dependent receptor [Verrucomicrobiota bacterium]